MWRSDNRPATVDMTGWAVRQLVNEESSMKIPNRIPGIDVGRRETVHAKIKPLLVT